MNIRKVGLIMLIVSVLAVVAGATSAQDDPSTVPPVERNRPGLRGVAQEIVQLVASELGLQPADLLPELRDGKSLAAIIAENNGDVAAISAQIVAAATEHINNALAAGYITQERADNLLANLEAAVSDTLNREPRLGQGRGGRDGRPGRQHPVAQGLIRLAAAQTGLEPQAIIQQLRDGATLGSILADNGVDTAAFIDAAVAEASARLGEQVAQGRITQERADQMLANFREKLTERLHESFAPQQTENGINT